MLHYPLSPVDGSNEYCVFTPVSILSEEEVRFTASGKFDVAERSKSLPDHTDRQIQDFRRCFETMDRYVLVVSFCQNADHSVDECKCKFSLFSLTNAQQNKTRC